MNKLFLMNHPDLFQGQKYLDTKRAYFEGWYFKHSNNQESIAFIPGISICQNESKAFIQVITNKLSYYLNYSIADFKFQSKPFSIQIGNSTFSKEKIHIDIEDKKQNLIIYGDIRYSKAKNIKKTFLRPNIMGPFSYIPFMECNHAILSMKHKLSGSLTINHHKMKLNHGVGYIEKDWGTSFPETYIWCQGNQFKKKKASFMLSIAEIPFLSCRFQGVICALLIDHQEFIFATYCNTKIIEYVIKDNSLKITLKKGNYKLTIESKQDAGLELIAPIKGRMEKSIIERLDATITITLKKKQRVIFSDTSICCGLEIV